MNQSPYGQTENVVAFGDEEHFAQTVKSINGDGKASLNLIAADDLLELGAKIFTYEYANQMLQGRNAIVIGLSDVGFNNSLIDLSTANLVYTGNNADEFKKFKSKRLPSSDVEQKAFGLYSISFLEKLMESSP